MLVIDQSFTIKSIEIFCANHQHPRELCFRSSCAPFPKSKAMQSVSWANTIFRTPFLRPPDSHQLPPKKDRFLVFRPTRCQKMFVPGFAEASPEAKAARNLQDFFTFIAVRIVLAQLESYNPEAYKELMEFISRNSLNDGDKFCRTLMRESPRHKGLALRILEVRSAYSKRDFEWDNLQKLAFKMVDDSNTRLMRDYVLETSHLESEK